MAKNLAAPTKKQKVAADKLNMGKKKKSE